MVIALVWPAAGCAPMRHPHPFTEFPNRDLETMKKDEESGGRSGGPEWSNGLYQR